MNDYPIVELDDDDILCHTYIDSQRGVLMTTQISIVAPQTIEKFKDAGCTIEEGVLMGKDGKPVPVEPPTRLLQSLESTVRKKK